MTDATESLESSPEIVDVDAGGVVGDTSLAALFREMEPAERRTYWACATGYALDGFDFMVYTLVLGTVIAYWSVDRGAAGLTVTATLICSAAGGWLAGYLSDRIGRVRTLQITVLWFSVFSLLSAFAQSFFQLAVFRALLGFGFGGEWTAGAVLMGETIRARYRGRAVGCVQAGWAVGWGTAVFVQAILFSVAPAERAWRWMFALGFLPAIYVLVVRRFVAEPPAAKAIRAESSHRIWEIFAPDILKTTALAALLGVGAQGGYYAVMTWLPIFLQSERHLTVVGSTSYLAFLVAGALSGYLVGAWLSDRVGRRNLFLLSSISAIVMVLVYTRVPVPNGVLWLLGYPLGFVASAYYAGMGAFLAEVFPTKVRGSGMGFCYNFGRGLGAAFPALVGFLSATMPLSRAIAIFATIAYSILFVAAFLLPETRGRRLAS